MRCNGLLDVTGILSRPAPNSNPAISGSIGIFQVWNCSDLSLLLPFVPAASIAVDIAGDVDHEHYQARTRGSPRE